MHQEPFAVAQDRPADSEEPDPHDGRQQVQNGRLLARPQDEPARQSGEGNGKEGGEAPTMPAAANLPPTGDSSRPRSVAVEGRPAGCAFTAPARSTAVADCAAPAVLAAVWQAGRGVSWPETTG